MGVPVRGPTAGRLRAAGSGALEAGLNQAADAGRSVAPLVHHGLRYASQQEFLAGAVPFLLEGLERGESVWVVARAHNAACLRAALGPDARNVVFHDCRRWYQHPVRALAALDNAVRRLRGRRQRLRMIGEPAWMARPGRQQREWARHEALVNVALATASASLMCAYDTRVLDAEQVAQVGQTHPTMMVGDSPRPSSCYRDPVLFSAECDRFPLPDPPPEALRLAFNRLGQLATLREFMTSYATWAGARAQAVEQFVQALDEVATNVMEHGGGVGVLRLWTGPRVLSCEVSDSGAGIEDPLAGQLPPPAGRVGGCGLWLARQFCDLVEVRSNAAGTTVRLHLALP